MSVHPILFSAPMIRALLEGRKTQTRRIVNPAPQPFPRASGICEDDSRDVTRWGWPTEETNSGIPIYKMLHSIRCPYGKPGDLLWVREAWSFDDAGEFPDGRQCIHFEYLADGARKWVAPDVMPKKMRKYPSIHMPRWGSRLTLELTEVRVERLQDISNEDAIAEGIEKTVYWRNEHPPSICYSVLWNAINGSGSWNANSWVWALTFKVHQINIDQMPQMEAA